MTRPIILPEFANDDINDPVSGKPNVSEPSQSLKDTGWTRRQKPYRQHFNWLHRTTNLWLKWFDSLFDAGITDSAIIFDQALLTTSSPIFSGLTVNGNSISALGTPASLWGLDNDAVSYPQLKNDGGILRIRNKDDNDDADLIVKNLTVNGTTTTGDITTSGMLYADATNGIQIGSGSVPHLGLLDNGSDRFSISITGTDYTSRYLQLGRDDGNNSVVLPGKVGIGTAFVGSAASSKAALDIAAENITMVLGSDIAAVTRTDNHIKYSRVGAIHYTIAEEPAAIFFTDCDASTNTLKIGGGTSCMNAMTKIDFITASNNTTTTGTTRMTIDSSGSIVYYGTDQYIKASTSDGSDTSRLMLCGGGTLGVGRGGSILLYGNEYNNATYYGSVRIQANNIFLEGEVNLGNFGMVAGSPIGGNKGAGTINAKAVYDDGSLLTKYALDYFYDSKFDASKYETEKKAVNRFIGYAELVKDLDAYNAFVHVHHSLPTFYDLESKGERPSNGDLGQRCWEELEVKTYHIEQLNKKIKELKEEIRIMKLQNGGY